MTSESSVLKKADIEKILGEPLSAISIGSGANKGDNVAGNLLAIKATTASGDTRHVVYKGFPSANPEQLQYIIQFGIFKTEVCMYEVLFPRLRELLNHRKNVTNKNLPVAKYISGFNDDRNDYVCLEDVRPQGYKMQDKFHSLTLAEVKLVMREMARFHATTYFLLKYDGERIFEDNERLHRIKHSPFTTENPFMEEMGSRMFHSHLENTVELLKPRDESLSESVRNFLQRHDRHAIHKLIRFNAMRTDKQAFACIIHGDCWTNNILFKYEKEGDRDTPTDLKFIDFQASRRGNIFEDLGYFFWTSTTPDFRKQYLDLMLSEYYSSFENTLTCLEFPKPIGFTRGKLIDQFHEGILPAYVYMPFALSLQMGDLDFMMGKEEDPVAGDEQQASNGVIDEGEGGGPPVIDFEKMAIKDKGLMMKRMLNSPRALARLEDLTREIVQMKLL